MNDVTKLDDRQLPPIEMFYNKLTKTACSEYDYIKAKQAWNDFQCKSLKDYMLAYLKLDVHQLADVFEAFRKLVKSDDGVDPVNFYGIPGKYKRNISTLYLFNITLKVYPGRLHLSLHIRVYIFYKMKQCMNFLRKELEGGVHSSMSIISFVMLMVKKGMMQPKIEQKCFMLTQ